MNKPDPLKVAAAHEANARKQIAYNRRARYEFEILDTYEAGLVLVGTEVLQLKTKRLYKPHQRGNVTSLFVTIKVVAALVFY